MEKANILLIGNSGVGKSTLINAILEEKIVETGSGTEGTTKELRIYEKENLPFRLIDSVGFEPSLFKAKAAIDKVRKWTKETAKKGEEEKQINVIWFCVDGTSRKLFPSTIDHLCRATSVWKTVPIVVVITKSYSIPEREENIRMVEEAFAKQRRSKRYPRKIIPVVASTYVLNETAFAPPEGITELIDITNELIPEGIRCGKNDLDNYILSRKRAMSTSLIGASTAAATVIGAVPISFPDATLLIPLERAEIAGLAKIYGIEKGDQSNKMMNMLIEVGTVSVAARSLIQAFKSIPGINIAAGVLNAVIAGSVAGALGGGTRHIFEQIYLGEKKVEDVDWAKKILETQLSGDILKRVNDALERLSGNPSKESVMLAVKEIVAPDKKK